MRISRVAKNFLTLHVCMCNKAIAGFKQDMCVVIKFYTLNILIKRNASLAQQASCVD